MFLNWSLVVCLAFVHFYVIALPYYQQNDYDIKYERAEVVWYDRNLVKNGKVLCYWLNRTQRAINASGYLNLGKNVTTDLVGELQMYKFMSNEYRHFPLRLSTNLCEEYAKNNFGIQDIIRNYSNMEKCPLKEGFYYVYKFWPDFSRLPPFIPRGRYKAVGKLYYNKKFVAEGHGYGSVEDKVKKW